LGVIRPMAGGGAEPTDRGKSAFQNMRAGGGKRMGVGKIYRAGSRVVGQGRSGGKKGKKMLEKQERD